MRQAGCRIAGTAERSPSTARVNKVLEVCVKENSAAVELLAPGGSVAGIRAAVAAGADAVYAGGRLFGARAFADNPDDAGVLEMIDYCHLRGVRFYLTVNTLLKEKELRDQLFSYIKPIAECGVDAVLVQDLGVFHFLRENFPDLPLHASTQMTIGGAGGARLLQSMGAERVVLSRELSLSEISEIRRQCDVELETFVHGALCYCYSGQCLMSSMIGGRSGNRGRCAQPCRLPYELSDGKPGEDGKRISSGKDRYLLSLKDICTLDILPDLIEAGISSLKVEGRMKRPEYTAGVTSIYRKYIDLYRKEGREGYKVAEADRTALADLFSRGGFSEGYYRQKSGPSMMASSRPDHSGTRAASVVKAGGVITLKALEDLYPGDSLLIGGNEYRMPDLVRTGRTFTAHKPPSFRKAARGEGKADLFAGKPDARIHKGRKDPALRTREGRSSAAPSVKAGDIVMRVRAQHLSDCIGAEYLQKEKKVPAEAEAVLCPGKALSIRVRSGDVCAEAEGGIVEQAQARPLTDEAVRKQVGKTGDTPFALTGLKVSLEGDVFCPLGEINSVRREAFRKLQEELLLPFRRQEAETMKERPDAAESLHVKAAAHPAVTAMVLTSGQLKAVLEDPTAGGVYIDASMLLYPSSPKARQVVSMVHDASKKVYLALPTIWRLDVEKAVRAGISDEDVRLFDGVLYRSIDQLSLIDEYGGGEAIADAGLYTWNSEAFTAMRKLGLTCFTDPLECTSRELEERVRADGRPGEVHFPKTERIVYGRIPLMVTAQCLRKNTAGCSRVPSFMSLTDRKKISFPVRNECAVCTNIIYNSVPLDLISAGGGYGGGGPSSVRYSFTTETEDETRQILRGQLPEAITRGHIRKGVE